MNPALAVLMLLVFLLLNLGLTADASDSARPQITWVSPAQQDVEYFNQPVQISIATDTTNLLVKQLHGYELKLMIAPMQRIERLLQAKNNVCVPNRIKTPKREREELFSLPYSIHPQMRLYRLKTAPPLASELLNQKAQLKSLKRLFEHSKDAVLGINAGRSYGKILDAQIAHLKPRNLFIQSVRKHFSLMTDMLFRKRVDYILKYPTDLKIELAAMDAPPALQSIELASVPRYALSHITCNKSPIGRRFISDVNQILTKLHHSEALYQAHRRYLNQADIRQFDLDYQAVFKTK